MPLLISLVNCRCRLTTINLFHWKSECVREWGECLVRLRSVFILSNKLSLNDVENLVRMIILVRGLNRICLTEYYRLEIEHSLDEFLSKQFSCQTCQ